MFRRLRLPILHGRDLTDDPGARHNVAHLDQNRPRWRARACDRKRSSIESMVCGIGDRPGELLASLELYPESLKIAHPIS